MPEINLILQKERNRRALILNIFGAILFLITFFFSVFGMLVYGISLYIAVPLGLASSVFGLVLATTFLVSRFFGFYLYYNIVVIIIIQQIRLSDAAKVIIKFQNTIF